MIEELKEKINNMQPEIYEFKEYLKLVRPRYCTKCGLEMLRCQSNKSLSKVAYVCPKYRFWNKHDLNFD